MLIIEDKFRLRTLLSTFLASMGCEYGIAASTAALDALRRETFEVVLLDLVSCEGSAEQLLSDLLALRRNLSARIVAITEDVVSPRTKDLTSRHSLVQIPRSRLSDQLWPTLQTLLNLPPAFRAHAKIARLTFDSFQLPLTAGVGASRQSGRNLVYRHEGVRVDLLIKPLRASGQVSLVGQLLDTVEPEHGNDNLPVVLSGLSGPLARTITNQHGEFALEFAAMDYAGLRIQAKEGSWVFIPLGDMSWLTKPLALWA